MTLNPLLPLMYEPIVRTALLEDLGRAGDLAAARAELPALEEVLRRLRAALREWAASRPAP